MAISKVKLLDLKVNLLLPDDRVSLPVGLQSSMDKRRLMVVESAKQF